MVFVPSSVMVRLRGSYAEDRGPIPGRGLAFLYFFLISCIYVHVKRVSVETVC